MYVCMYVCMKADHVDASHSDASPVLHDEIQCEVLHYKVYVCM